MQKAFTIVELLVVVAIIAVLLALLAPAMDKAMYQAELATCAAQIKGVATAVQTYAAASQRRYPQRKLFDVSPPNTTATKLMGVINNVTYDDRLLFKTMVPINKMLQCPLINAVDLESNLSTSQVYGSYSLYFGAKYTGYKGMKKLGDRWTWADTTYEIPARNYALNIMVGDHDITYKEPVAAASQLAQGGHPDADNKLRPLVVYNTTNTYSAWNMAGDYHRGTIEMNFATDDGAVTPYTKIGWDDDRMAKVPWDSGNFASGHYMQVPR